MAAHDDGLFHDWGPSGTRAPGHPGRASAPRPSPPALKSSEPELTRVPDPMDSCLQSRADHPRIWEFQRNGEKTLDR